MKVRRLARLAAIVCIALLVPLVLGLARRRCGASAVAAFGVVGPPAAFFWRQEAEAGAVTSPMAIGVDYGASACEYVYSPGNTGTVSWTIDIPVAGYYCLWVRAMGLSWTHNSFWISVDGVEPFHYEIPYYGGWTWYWEEAHPVDQRVEPMSLTEGPHTLTVAARESMARLDCLVLTNDASYWPVIVTPCDLTPTPSPTPQASRTPFPSPTPILEARNLTLMDQIGGSQRALMAQGERLYVGLGMRLEVVNISDPLCPRSVGRTEPLGGPVQAVYVSGDYAFVAAEDGGLHVVDVSDPTAPRGVGRYWLPCAKDVALAGHHAFVMASDGMYVLDVADPSSPSLVGVYHYEWRNRWWSPWVRISGQYAFVYLDHALRILDVSNPSAPIQVRENPALWPGSQDLYIDGLHAYLVVGSRYRASLRLLDIADPLTPVETGYCLLAKDPVHERETRAVHAWGDYVCVIMEYTERDMYGGEVRYVALAVVDVSDPTAPALLATLTFPDAAGLAGDVWVAEGAAFLAVEGETLQVVDVADPAHPVAVAGCVLPAWRAQDVHAGLDYAFVAAAIGDEWCGYAIRCGGTGGVAVVETSDLGRLAQVSRLMLGCGADAIVGADQTVFVALNYWETMEGTYHSLVAVDVSNPRLPVCVGGFGYPQGRVDGLFASGDMAYATVNWEYQWPGHSYMQAFHLPSGTSAVPCFLSDIGGSDVATRLSVAGDYAYIVSPVTGLQVLDLTTGAVVTTLRLPDTSDICLVADHAYLAGDDLLIVDVSDPEHPAVAATHTLPGQADRVDINGRYAHVATDTGLYVLDLADPLHPVEVASYHSIVGVRNICAVDSCLYVAAEESGLFLLRFGVEPTVTPTPTTTQTPGGYFCLPIVLKGR